MKNFIYALLGIIFATSITGCAHETVYNVEHHPTPPGAKKLTLQQMGQRIQRAVAKRSWRCDETTPHVLICHHEKRTHKAIVQIDYNRDFFAIHNVKSENLNYGSGKIHKKYNRWIKDMEKDIMDALSAPVYKTD